MVLVQICSWSLGAFSGNPLLLEYRDGSNAELKFLGNVRKKEKKVTALNFHKTQCSSFCTILLIDKKTTDMNVSITCILEMKGQRAPKNYILKDIKK